MRRAVALLAGLALVVVLVPSATAYTVSSAGAAYVASSGSITVSAGASIADAVNTADDGKFVQLAPAASITLAFAAGTYAAPDGTAAADLTVHTFDIPYPAEATVQVYVKSNTNAWVSLGMVKDYTGDVGLNLEGVGLINEVMLVQNGYIDPAYPELGFDLDAVTTDHAVGLTESCAAVTPGVYPGWTFVSTVFVSAVGPGSSTPVVTTAALEDGVAYRFEARGLYSAGPASGPGTEILADARYSQRVVGQATPGDSVYGYEGYGPTLLDLLLDGAAAGWTGAAFNASHAYTVDRVGTGTPVTLEFQVYDIAAANNIGGLCVSLYTDEVPTGEIVSPADGATYALGEDLAIEANYYDDDPGSAVFWAVRVDENVACTNLGDNQYWGNVDGDTDPYTWLPITGGKQLLSTAPTTGWPAGDYCFVFNPGAGDSVPAGEYDVRLISRFTLAANTAPVADPNGPYLVAVGGTVSFDGSASSDADGDQITYAWTAAGGTLTGPTLVNPTFTAGATPGIYDVSLTVTDEHGAVSAPASTTVVVYDPTGGFVTGGGWIMSPEGAYSADVTLTGKATFGFVSKYKKGALVPDGNTEFQFKAGGLNFSSTSYQWLVVNQSYTNAQFKGSGTINGAGTFGFMLWATDGAKSGTADTFRIQITDADGVTVYDNGVQQAIGGGSIVVHK